MQRTTKLMFAHYMTRNQVLDIVWMRRRRLHILHGEFEAAMIKQYHIYSEYTYAVIDRKLDYPSPLFDRARKHQCKSR